MLAAAAVLFGLHRYQWSTMNRADGVVVGRDSLSQRPVVRFHSVADQPIEFVADDGGASVGDSVRVLYDPRQPRDARVWSFRATWLVAVIVALIGVAIGIGAYAVGARRMADTRTSP
jgi:hypothetical protein